MSGLVSISVITYNSAKTVLETLESIKAQTYPNIELIISDDCSTDNTVEVCKKWVDANEDRFARIETLTADKNTGVSGNLNRAEVACTGEWVKIIAGDDILMPNCVQDCMDYIEAHPDTIYLFGKQKAFGADNDYCARVDEWFDYSFFAKTPEEQLQQLIYEGNCLPATSTFYHREHAHLIGIKNDERIPAIEDWPKWINLLKAGVKLHFVDKVLVKYRVGGSSTEQRPSLLFYRANRLMCFYYLYPEWYKANPEYAVERVVEEECSVYQMLLEAESIDQNVMHQERNRFKQQYENYYRRYEQITNSLEYRLGRILLKPLRWFRKK